MLKKLFGYERRERRASMVLVILVLLVIVVRIAVPEKKIKLEYFSLNRQHDTNTNPFSNLAGKVTPFDPNTADYESLISAGLNQRQAKNIINYRKAGGLFRKPEDLFRLYTIDSATAKMLIPYIYIAKDSVLLKEVQSKMPAIDLNLSDSADFVKLPGIGPVYASRIVKYRKLLGGFFTSSQLKEVYGISDSLYFLLFDRIKVDTSVIIKIRINESDFNTIAMHPY
ncbi:MAG: ComEA family DNA-binding protein, partial [Bacteroidales bacterium]